MQYAPRYETKVTTEFDDSVELLFIENYSYSTVISSVRVAFVSTDSTIGWIKNGNLSLTNVHQENIYQEDCRYIEEVTFI